MAKFGTPEYWKNVSEGLKKHYKNNNVWNKGKTYKKKYRLTNEQKKHVSDGVKKAWADGKYKKANYKKTPEQRKKLSDAKKKFYKDHPEVAKEHSDKLKGRFKGKNNPNYGKRHIGLNSGTKNFFWRDGVATLTYRGLGWKRRSKEIRKRDNYTCQDCGSRGNLQVHHIIPYNQSKDNSDKNLITLCNSCHQKRECNINKSRKIPNL